MEKFHSLGFDLSTSGQLDMTTDVDNGKRFILASAQRNFRAQYPENLIRLKMWEIRRNKEQP